MSAVNSKNTINDEIQNTMKFELQSNSNQINADIAESAQDTSVNSADITETVDQVSVMVDDVEDMSTEISS